MKSSLLAAAQAGLCFVHREPQGTASTAKKSGGKRRCAAAAAPSSPASAAGKEELEDSEDGAQGPPAAKRRTKVKIVAAEIQAPSILQDTTLQGYTLTRCVYEQVNALIRVCVRLGRSGPFDQTPSAQ
jgi:hypothetical protein